MEVAERMCRLLIILSLSSLICACHEPTPSQQQSSTSVSTQTAAASPPTQSASSRGSSSVAADPCTEEGQAASGPPSADGRIAAVDSNRITLEAGPAGSGGPRTIVLVVADKTRICTVYGGYVAPGELAVGQRARIWLAPDSQSKNGLTVAAAIMVASTKPGDDWP